MEQVAELSDWVWLVVVLLWVAVQILPRLFRSEKKKAAERSPRRRPARAAEPPGTPEVMRHPDAKPIEPH